MIVDQIIYFEDTENNLRCSNLYIDGVYQCQTIENLNKAIDTGVYELALRRELTPLTKAYRIRYSWFQWFAEIQVADRTNIYIHSANYAHQLRGCVAPASYIYGDMGSLSVSAWLKFYKNMQTYLQLDTAVYRVSKVVAINPFLQS